LDGAGELLAGHTLLLRGRDVERQQDGRGAVDGEAGADLVQRDAVEEHLGIGERVDSDSDAADLLPVLRVIGVVATLGWQVQRDREPRTALIQEVSIALVRLLGGPESRILPERPGFAPVAGREVAAGERVLPWRRRVGRAVTWSVHRLQRDARRGLEDVAHRGRPPAGSGSSTSARSRGPTRSM
jgi:hypothetical protein